MTEREKERDKDREDRRRVRRLLWRWARVASFCARRHKDIEEYSALIESAADIRPQQLTGMPHGSGSTDPTERAAARIAQLREMYSDRIAELSSDIDEEMRFYTAVSTAVETLEYTGQTIIDMKYRRELNYDRIAERTGYTPRRVQQIEREAVDKLLKLIVIEEVNGGKTE